MPAANTDKFAKATATFSTTLNGGISAGATTLTLNSVTGLPTDTAVILTIDATDANGVATPSAKEVVIGVVSGSTITNLTRAVEGSAQSHSSGAVVVDYITAKHWNNALDAILVGHDQAGAHKAGLSFATPTITTPTITTGGSWAGSPTITAPTITTPVIKTWDGWQPIATAPTTVTNLGQRSYTVLYPGVDLTSSLSPGMRMKFTRTVTAPTQCADLESSSSQYFSKTSPNKLAFTTTFTCSAWIKLESYGAQSGIIARRNVDTEGWSFAVNASGQLVLSALRIASNNKVSVTYQSIPLNKWVHVAASMDVSVAGDASSVMYLDGVVVPHLTTTTGTCTALVQGTTALVVGATKSAGTEPFDGKIAQAAVFSAVISGATIRSYMSQGLAGNESNICSAYSLSNSIVDLNTTTPNDLSAQGSALATDTDTPFAGGATGTTEYGIVTKAAFSTDTTLTVQIPEGYALPTSGGISASSNSASSAPFGFPRSRKKWLIEAWFKNTASQSSAVTNTWYNLNSAYLIVPLGDWNLSYQNRATMTATSGSISQECSLSTSASAETDDEMTANMAVNAAAQISWDPTKTKYYSLAVAAAYYLISRHISGASVSVYMEAGITPTVIRGDFAYL